MGSRRSDQLCVTSDPSNRRAPHGRHRLAPTARRRFAASRRNRSAPPAAAKRPRGPFAHRRAPHPPRRCRRRATSSGPTSDTRHSTCTPYAAPCFCLTSWTAPTIVESRSTIQRRLAEGTGLEHVPSGRARRSADMHRFELADVTRPRERPPQRPTRPSRAPSGGIPRTAPGAPGRVSTRRHDRCECRSCTPIAATTAQIWGPGKRGIPSAHSALDQRSETDPNGHQRSSPGSGAALATQSLIDQPSLRTGPDP